MDTPYSRPTVPLFPLSPSSVPPDHGPVSMGPPISTTLEEKSPNAVRPPRELEYYPTMSLCPISVPPKHGLVSVPMGRCSQRIEQGHTSPTIGHQSRRRTKRRKPYAQPGDHMQKRRNPPHPFTSYAVLLANIIRNSPKRKMTLQEIYDHLKVNYPDHFPDD